MSSPAARPPRRAVALAPPVIAVAVLLATLALVSAGCGSSSGTGTSADPAAAVPASAALFAGATVRPGGAQKTAALAAGKALTGQANPYLRLLQVLQVPGSPALSFKRDVAGWLGPHAGVFLSSLGSSGRLLGLLQQGLLGGSSSGAAAFPFGAGGAQGAIVLDTSDAAKARSFLDGAARHAGAHATTYRGVSYQAASGGLALGLVGRFAVIGSEAGMHGVIDTTLGGPPLARASGYSTLLSAAPPGALAHVYANAGSLSAGGAPQEGSGLLQLLAGAHDANISLVPAAGSIALDVDALAGGPAGAAHSPAGSAGGLLSSGAEGAQALGELPGESWLAVGLGHAGGSLGADVQGLQALASLGSTGPQASASPGLSVKGLFEGLLTPLRELGAGSAQARHDFASWMGSAGVFASGASLLELRAAVVIASQNPALSRAAVGKLGAQLRKAGGSVSPVSIAGADAAIGVRLAGLPVELDIADGRDAGGHTKFVLGLGQASVMTALHPPSTLAGAASYTAAGSALGEGIKPSLTLDFPTLLGLLEGVGLIEDPTISKFVPYLRRATTLAGGGRSLGGGVERFRLVLGLRPSAG
ncbi:MAG TPA: DUF3352 domain-containing protein [Solirubrobacteraceae bacterium]|nr:DUF3352 domain-containing protein [Solirubrobacteraceae bacterium]